MNWHENIFNKKISSKTKHWTELSDFNDDIGDIKGIWENSRLSFIPIFCINYISGHEKNIDSINYALHDWIVNNKPFYGPNWKCGQESSLRVLNIAMGLLILGQIKKQNKTLCELIEAHLIRIKSTFHYAVSQNNNHSISESAALYIGGSLLFNSGSNSGRKYQVYGKYWLEKNLQKLIQNDGTFSQYSTNYHRFVLDLISFVEIFRQNLGLTKFSSEYQKKCSLACNWLNQMVDINSGDCPNLGANDGAHFFSFAPKGFRDFKFSAQIGNALFKKSILARLSKEELHYFNIFNINVPDNVVKAENSFHFKNGGFLGYRNKKIFALLNYPNYNFRPTQSDILHLDCWVDGENVLCDGGTFSYYSQDHKTAFYRGVKSHNTVEFNERDQMPLISRFLYGSWPKPLNTFQKNNEMNAGYRDYENLFHNRNVKIDDCSICITDTLKGDFNIAKIFWRLPERSWKQVGNSIYCEDIGIEIVGKNLKINMSKTFKSKFYFFEESADLIVIEVPSSDSIKTKIKFK